MANTTRPQACAFHVARSAKLAEPWDWHYRTKAAPRSGEAEGFVGAVLAALGFAVLALGLGLAVAVL